MEKSCFVFAAPSQKAAVRCQGKKGDSVTFADLKKYGNRYYHVDIFPDCRGFVLDSCVGIEGGRTTAMLREPDEALEGIAAPPMQFGFSAHFDGLWGSVGYAEGSSKGLSYGASFTGTFFLSRQVRLLFGAGYDSFKLTRTIDSSGIIEDPTGTEFTQKMTYVSPFLIGGYRLTPFTTGSSSSAVRYGTKNEEIVWWWDLGAQYLIPLSATQEDSIYGSRTVDLKDRPLLLTTGLSGNYSLTSQTELMISLWGYYNVAAKGGSKLIGARLGVALLTSF